MFGIIISGDSISFGRGEIPNIGWAGRLKKYFEPQGSHNCLFNLGIPGNTSTKLLKGFEAELKSRVSYYFPDNKFLILIAIGINDARKILTTNKIQTTSIKFKKNISKLIGIAKKYSEDIVIVGLTPVDENLTLPFEDTFFHNKDIKKYNGFLKEMAKNKKVEFINLYDKLHAMQYANLLSDGVHPNSQGYGAIYKIVKQSLIKKKYLRK